MKALFMAHRCGVYKGTRQNSIESIHFSLKDSSDMIEIDVCSDRAGNFVMYHPMTAHQFINYKSGRFPLFSDALGLIRSKKPVYVDIKDENLDIHKLIALLDEYGQKKAVLGSFAFNVLEELSQNYPDFTLSMHCLPRQRVLANARKLDVDWVSPIPYRIRETFIDSIRLHGFKFAPGGNENYPKQLHYYRRNAQVLSTYHCDELREYIKLRIGKNVDYSKSL